MDRLTRPPLLGLVATIQLALLVVVAGIHLAALSTPVGSTAPGTGDFLAFWTGAVMLHSGEGAQLYDFAAQREVQALLLGERPDWFQGYLNPPLLAWILSAAVPIGFVNAFYLFCAISAGAFVAGSVLLLRELRHLAPRPVDRYVAIALMAGFHPIIRTLAGGQNTALTLALAAGMFVALKRGSWLVAGLLLGLLTYKPQYAIGMGLAVLALREFRVLGIGMGIGLLHAVAGAVVVGRDWPLRMLQGLAAYYPLELEASAHLQFSWVRVAGALVPGSPGEWIGAGGALVVLGLIVARGVRLSTSHERFPAYFALAVAGTMLASPHLQYYEAGLLVLPAVLLLDQRARAGPVPLGPRLLLAGAYVGYPLYLLADRIAFQPLFIVLAGVFIWALRITFRPVQRIAEPTAAHHS